MTHKLRWIGFFGALLTITATQTGCSTLAAMFKKKPSAYQVRKQKQAEQRKKDEATYKVVAAQKSCDGLDKAYSKIYNVAAGKQERRNKTAIHLGKCGHWDMVFRRLTQSNQRSLNQMMDSLVAAKLPVHKEYDKWLSSAKYPYKWITGWYTFTWMRNWLSKAPNPQQHCKAMWENRSRATQSMRYKYKWRVRSMMIGYLFMAKCKSYKSQITSLLTSNSWRDRNQACAFLKDWGSKSDLSKLNALSSTDPYSYINRRVRIYPVRDTCRSAIGRIRMRN